MMSVVVAAYILGLAVILLLPGHSQTIETGGRAVVAVAALLFAPSIAVLASAHGVAPLRHGTWLGS